MTESIYPTNSREISTQLLKIKGGLLKALSALFGNAYSTRELTREEQGKLAEYLRPRIDKDSLRFSEYTEKLGNETGINPHLVERFFSKDSAESSKPMCVSANKGVISLVEDVTLTNCANCKWRDALTNPLFRACAIEPVVRKITNYKNFEGNGEITSDALEYLRIYKGIEMGVVREGLESQHLRFLGYDIEPSLITKLGSYELSSTPTDWQKVLEGYANPNMYDMATTMGRDPNLVINFYNASPIRRTDA